MEANSTVIEKYMARLLMLSFFLPMHLQATVLFAICGITVLYSFFNNERTPVYNYIPAVLLGSLYLLYLLAVPFTPASHLQMAHRYREYKMSYLILPILFAAISPRLIKVILNELVYFVYGTILCCTVANVWFVAKFGLAPGGFKGVNHVTYRIFFEEFTGIHPTYISMYLVFGIAILLLRGQFINRRFKYFMFYCMLAFLLPLLAKSPLIALVVIMIHTTWLRRKALVQYKWMALGVVLVLVMSYLFVPFVSQRVNEMTGMKTSLAQNVADNSIHERKMILAVDLSMVKDYWLTGCGPGRLMYLLKTRYFFYSMYYGRDVNSFDPHNEYFYQWICFGLVGIFLLLLALVMHVIKALKNKDNLYIYLLLTVCITFFTESVLATQHGLFFYAFFTSLLFFNQPKSSGALN